MCSQNNLVYPSNAPKGAPLACNDTMQLNPNFNEPDDVIVRIFCPKGCSEFPDSNVKSIYHSINRYLVMQLFIGKVQFVELLCI